MVTPVQQMLVAVAKVAKVAPADGGGGSGGAADAGGSGGSSDGVPLIPLQLWLHVLSHCETIVVSAGRFDPLQRIAGRFDPLQNDVYSDFATPCCTPCDGWAITHHCFLLSSKSHRCLFASWFRWRANNQLWLHVPSHCETIVVLCPSRRASRLPPTRKLHSVSRLCFSICIIYIYIYTCLSVYMYAACLQKVSIPC